MRVHVESEDSGDGGVTVEIVLLPRIETSVSLRLSNILARLRALTSRGDSFFREAPSFMRSGIACRHRVSMSFSPLSVLGAMFVPDVDSIHS